MVYEFEGWVAGNTTEKDLIEQYEKDFVVCVLADKEKGHSTDYRTGMWPPKKVTITIHISDEVRYEDFIEG
jgi:hypothetical protein